MTIGLGWDWQSALPSYRHTQHNPPVAYPGVTKQARHPAQNLGELSLSTQQRPSDAR
jgi:hypothetical protein